MTRERPIDDALSHLEQRIQALDAERTRALQAMVSLRLLDGNGNGTPVAAETTWLTTREAAERAQLGYKAVLRRAQRGVWRSRYVRGHGHAGRVLQIDAASVGAP